MGLPSRRVLPVSVLSVLLFLTSSACDVVKNGSGASIPDHTTVPEVGAPSTTTSALFDPANAIFPFPNDLLKQGTATLQIPASGTPLSPVAPAANSLDGFSTVAPILFPFSAPVDRASFAGHLVFRNITQNTSFGQPVQFRVTCADPGAEFATECTAAANLAVTPIDPLYESSTYLLALAGAVDADASPVVASPTFELLKATGPLVDIDGVTGAVTAINSSILAAEFLAPGETVADLSVEEVAALHSLALLQASYDTLFSLLETTLPDVGALPAPIVRDDVAVMIPYSTESLTGELSSIAAAIAADTPTFSEPMAASPVDAALVAHAPIPIDVFGIPSALNPDPGDTGLGLDNPLGVAADNIAAVIEGTFPSRDYQGATGYFHDADGDGALDWVASEVPFTLALPNTTFFVGQAAPVVVFQHGLLGNRGFLFAIANTLAARGIATAAIDLVGHGDRVADLIDNAAFADDRLVFAPDGVPDPSGAAFFNITDFRVLRDNFRQSTVDLLMFMRALTEPVNSDLATFNGHLPPGAVASGADGLVDIDAADLSVVGHSFGTAVAFDALALTNEVARGVLVMPEADLVAQFLTSLNFQDLLGSGLAALGAPAFGTPELLQLQAIAQAIVERADPLAYAAGVLDGALAGAAAKDLLMIEAIGDQTIANFVSDQLAKTAGVPVVTEDTAAANVGSQLAGLVKLEPADPGSPLSLDNAPRATHQAPILAGQDLDYEPGATVPAPKLDMPLHVTNPIEATQLSIADFVDVTTLHITIP
jgi:pimeloyl-ACP methyl ester carboxylesterase